MLKKIKFGLLKAIDLSALGFLEPYVRLAYGEEPRVQLRKIGEFTLVPLLMIVAGFVVWAYMISPNIKTNSGELPSPSVVMNATQSLHTFAMRENNKESAYTTQGETRERWSADVAEQLDAIRPEVEEADAAVQAARDAEIKEKEARIAPLQARVDEMTRRRKEQTQIRQAAFMERAGALAPSESAERDDFLGELAGLETWIKQQKTRDNEVKGQIKAIHNEKNPALLAALREQTAVAEREQYLVKMAEQLGKGNRADRIAVRQAKLDQARATFASAQGADAYQAARKVIVAEKHLAKAQASSYAKPATLYFQIQRSVLCVFAGFFLGSVIAIPVGMLCGLSKTFMAGVMPFIALFKPVSPIVWLPIALIVASALIPDPDKHWFTRWMWDLPLIGKYKINPAFLASAVTVAMCSLWATMVNTALGVASVDKDHLNVAKVLRLGFWSRLFKIVLPASLPLVFSGLRISLGVGWMVLIAAELLSSSEGIGKFVWDQFNNGASDSFAKMMVVVFVVGAIGLLLDRIMVVFQRLVSFEGSIAAV